MNRFTVLHCVRDWGLASERFVADTVGSCTATRAVLACEEVHGARPTGAVRVVEVGRFASWAPGRPSPSRATRAGLALVATAARAKVLHAHFGYWAHHTAAVARRLGRPWVLSLHGHDLLVELDGRPELAQLRDAALVVVPSAFMADRVTDAGFDADRVRVIPSGVDLARHPFRERQPDPDGRIVITFVGRFVPKKGPLDAAEAIAAVRRHHPRVESRFVGYGPLDQALRDRVAALDIRADVIDGQQPGAVERALDETHIVVTPSRTAPDGNAETLCMVNLEAQARGIPLVTARHGGIPEGVSDESAVLVEEGDLPALVEGLRSLISCPEAWPTIGRAGRELVVRRFELGAVTADLEEQYRSIVESGRPAPARAPQDHLPKVSVVISSYNRRALLSRALDALDSQTYPKERTEVVVVDNGSTDGTSEDLAGREAEYELSWLRQEINHSAAEGRNIGIAAATGDVVAFTDSDCRPVPTWLESLVAGLRRGVGIVQGRTCPDPQQEVTPLSRTQWVPWEFGLYETCNLAYTRAALADAGPGPFRADLADEVTATVGARIGRQAFGEDTDLAWRVKRAGHVTRFAVKATVHHHVFAPDTRYLLHRAALAASFPVLIKRVPELRSSMWRPWLLSPHSARVLAAVAGITMGVFRRRALMATAPYLWAQLQPRRPRRWSRVGALPVLVVRDLVQLAAQVWGSWKARRLVL